MARSPITSLSPAEQGAAVPVAPRLIAASKHRCAAAGVPTLPLQVIDAFLEIEPDYRVVRAMLLRLPLDSKQTEPLRLTICWHEQSCHDHDSAEDLRCGGVHDRCSRSRSIA